VSRKRVSIAFNEKEKDLLEHIINKGEVSSVIKQLIRADMRVTENDNLSQSVNELIEVVATLKFQMIDLTLAVKEINSKSSVSEKTSFNLGETTETLELNSFTSLDDL